MEDGERSQLENLRWLGIDDEKVQKLASKYRCQSELPDMFYQSEWVDQLLAEGKAYKSYVWQKKNWQWSVSVSKKSRGETPRYINEYLGMSEDEKTAYIAERLLALSQLFAWLSTKLVFTSGMTWLRAKSSSQAAVISVVTGLSETRRLPNL